MKHNTKKWQASLLCITLCGILTACGSGKESQAEDMKNSETIQINETDMGAQQENGTEKETGGMEENRLIGEQTFEVTLEPLGKVTFASLSAGYTAESAGRCPVRNTGGRREIHGTGRYF